VKQAKKKKMNKTIKLNLFKINFKQNTIKSFSIQSVKQQSEEKYKLVIIGGGTGGLATGSKFARKLGAKNIAIIDPAKYHCKYKYL
jgi:phosphoribosylpyrophosphate synthetase